MNEKRFPQIVSAIYELADELEKMFPGRHFTPDGHMVGSIGEALAEFYYGIALSPASAHCHDGVCNGVNVQVKTTQTERIAISSKPDHLLVLALKRDGSFLEIFNGPGELVWNLVAHKPVPKTGQYQVPFSKLRVLMRDVPNEQRLIRKQPNQ